MRNFAELDMMRKGVLGFQSITDILQYNLPIYLHISGMHVKTCRKIVCNISIRPICLNFVTASWVSYSQPYTHHMYMFMRYVYDMIRTEERKVLIPPGRKKMSIVDVCS